MSSLHNALAYDSKFLNAIEVGTGLKQDQEGVVRLGETLTPVIDINLRPDLLFLRGELFWAAFAFQAAVAAEFGFIGIGNNSTNQILTVEGCSVRGAMTLQLHHNPRATLAGTGISSLIAVARDQRAAASAAIPLQRLTQIEVWQGTDLAALSGFPFEETNAITQDYRSFLSAPWIVRPGGVLSAQGGTVNVSMGANFWGRIRLALPGEIPIG